MALEEPAGPSQPCLAIVAAENLEKALEIVGLHLHPPLDTWDHRELSAALSHQRFRGNITIKCRMDVFLMAILPLLLFPLWLRGAAWPFYRQNTEKTVVKLRGEDENEAQHPSQPSLPAPASRADAGIKSQIAVGGSSQEGKKRRG